MKRIIIREHTPIPPFGEPARELRILNKPLWLMQRDLLARYSKDLALEVDTFEEAQKTPLWEIDEELLIYKDNLFFNVALIDTFITEARASGHACQIAFSQHDRTITTHALPLQEGIREDGDVYVADMYFYPAGNRHDPRPLIIDTRPYEMGYYHIPSYMAPRGDLVYQIPERAFLSIENWVHIFLANTPMGVFAHARQTDEVMGRGRLGKIFKWQREDWQAIKPKLELVFTAFWERINPMEEQWRNHFLACKKLVKVGKNCSIDPTAIIHGPTEIGDNVYIGPGVVITNSIIGSNVNVMQGSQVMLSVISDRCFLPFNSAVFMSSMMENSMIAQNTCLQLGVVGRNTFLGANSVFTDFHLDNRAIKTVHRGKLQDVGLAVIGSAIGHNCKIGSGFVMFPGRMIGSDTTIYYGHQNPLYRKCVNVPDIPEEYNVPASDLHYYEKDDRPSAIYEWPGGNYSATSEHHYPQSGHAHYPQNKSTNNHADNEACTVSNAARQNNNRAELTEPLDMATNKTSTHVIY